MVKRRLRQGPHHKKAGRDEQGGERQELAVKKAASRLQAREAGDKIGRSEAYPVDPMEEQAECQENLEHPGDWSFIDKEQTIEQFWAEGNDENIRNVQSQEQQDA